ncbi:LptA/OstA family protein [Pelagibacterium halotolerans]|uniref:LptA/OstA family protein n=1 Tax=Pelagibacterium halotolerans TaxID=531813 RepID=UPI0038516263
MRHVIGLIALCALLAGPPVSAQENQQLIPTPDAAPAQQSGPARDDPLGADVLAEDAGDTVEITADDLQITEDANSALFTGNVRIVQGGMEMTAGQVDVLYGEGGPSDLVKFTASGGRVHMVTEDQTIDGDQAVYDFANRILVFTGNVIVVNASGRITSEELIIDTRAGTSSFAGGGTGSEGGRVTGIFTPGS